MARVKETTASAERIAEKKKTEKEKPILKEIRSQIQSLEKQKESIRAGVDVIPGLENLSPEEAMKNLDARINRLADTYVEEGGSRKQLGVGEKKTAKTRYVYEGGKLTLK
jgi:septation ring formation regulator EzrA